MHLYPNPHCSYAGKLPNWPAAKANGNNPDIMNIDTESKTVKAVDDAGYLFLDKSFGKNKKECATSKSDI